MIGIKGNSIIIGCDEANEYIKARLAVLHAERDELLEKLNNIDSQINIEMEKLHGVNNPPSDDCQCCKNTLPGDLKAIVGKLIV